MHRSVAIRHQIGFPPLLACPLPTEGDGGAGAQDGAMRRRRLGPVGSAAGATTRGVHLIAAGGTQALASEP